MPSGQPRPTARPIVTTISAQPSVFMGSFPLFLELVGAQQRRQHVDGHHDRARHVEDRNQHGHTRLSSTARRPKAGNRPPPVATKTGSSMTTPFDFGGKPSRIWPK